MPPHPVLTEILLKYLVQLHQLSPNAITQLSNYFWAVISFDGEPSSDDFTKHYELHYQLKKVVVDGFHKFQQFGVINFHARRGGEAGLTLAVKNKWSSGWTKAWFYCKVPLHICRQGGKSVHAPRSHMSTLRFRTKPSYDCSSKELGDDTFIWSSKCIGGRDIVEEFMSCGVWPLATDVNFEQVKDDLTPILKLKVSLPRFPLSREDEEDDVKFLARVEQEVRVIVGSYTRTEHEACIAGLQNNGRLNRVLNLVGVAYGPHPVLVSTEALKKRKVDATRKVLAKLLKACEKKKVETAKVAAAQVKGGLKWSSDTDISSAKSAKLSKNNVPHTIASAAAVCITPEVRGSKNASGVLVSKADGGGPGSKTVVGAKKATTSIKKHIIPAIGARVEISLEGTDESSPHGQAPKVHSRAEPQGQFLEPWVRSPMTSILGPNHGIPWG
jgi:hypothetical protein